ncbi:hypothetical protein [Mycobacterium sp. NPDC050041]|uniref:phage fiber-tail adaptor protein n=1 Tax=Mycobacterium sp. NPDC050041 TaxID=3364293 RepID=UPI003C2CE9C9
MNYQIVRKDPDAVLDYVFDWSEWLDGDTISSATVTIEGPTGDTSITVDDSSFTDTTTTVWLSAGTENHNYLITWRVVTAGGRTDDYSALLQVVGG